MNATQLLKGKTALITGGTSGIGLASAELFVAHGARVAVCGRSPDAVQEASRRLGEPHLSLACDVSSVPAIEDLVSTVAQTFGTIDILFANAGIAFYKPLPDWTELDFDRMFGVNVRGQFFTVQKAVPYMADGGVIILTGSIAARLGQPGMSLYAASKSVSVTLAKNFSADLLDRRIRVLCLTPGPVKSRIFERDGRTRSEAEETLREVAQRVPIRRVGEAQELAQAALFLASDASAYMLGADLVLDGGKSQL